MSAGPAHSETRGTLPADTLLVDHQEAFQQLLDTLEGVEEISLDTEADSLHAYREKLCLLQLAAGPQCWLVDPLAEFSIAPLLTLFGQKNLILHGADYDLRLLGGEGMPEPVEIFDTMMAARLVGETAFSLGDLVERFCGVTLTKASQKANWGKRPLTPVLMEYAANDARYLSTLRELLTKRLEELGRVEWHREYCLRLQKRMIHSAGQEPDRDAWRITGCNRLPPRALAALKQLWEWREKKACERDRPVCHILHNKELLTLAGQIEEPNWEFPHRLRGSRLRQVQAIMSQVLQMPEEELPRKIQTRGQRASDEQKAAFEEIKKRRNALGEELGLDPSLLISKRQIEALVYRNDLQEAGLMSWQRQLMNL